MGCVWPYGFLDGLPNPWAWYFFEDKYGILFRGFGLSFFSGIRYFHFSLMKCVGPMGSCPFILSRLFRSKM